MDFGENKTLIDVIKEVAFSGTYFRDIYSVVNPLDVCDVTLRVGGTCRKCVWHNITKIKYPELLALCLTKYCVHGPAVAVKFNQKIVSVNKGNLFD